MTDKLSDRPQISPPWFPRW